MSDKPNSEPDNKISPESKLWQELSRINLDEILNDTNVNIQYFLNKMYFISQNSNDVTIIVKDVKTGKWYKSKKTEEETGRRYKIEVNDSNYASVLTEKNGNFEYVLKTSNHGGEYVNHNSEGTSITLSKKIDEKSLSEKKYLPNTEGFPSILKSKDSDKTFMSISIELDKNLQLKKVTYSAINPGTIFFRHTNIETNNDELIVECDDCKKKIIKEDSE